MKIQKDDKIVTPQLQVEIKEKDLNNILALRHVYKTKYGKINQKKFLALIIQAGYNAVLKEMEK